MFYKPPTLLVLATGFLASTMAASLKPRETFPGQCVQFPNDVAGGCRLDADGRIFSCTYGSCIGDDGEPIPGGCDYNTDNNQVWCPSAKKVKEVEE